MLFCPNPSCPRHAGKTKKPFFSDKSFSHHLQQSPACKAFLFVEQTSLNAPSIWNPSQQPSYSSHLFKKQRLRFNPTVCQQQHSNNTKRDSEEDQSQDDDDVCFAEFSSPANPTFSPLDSCGREESSGRLFDHTELPEESDYSCFTASQQCVTHLIYLLDEMECPDYGFQAIMEWARKWFEAGFDFNPKCKKRSGNLSWMYGLLHNAEQMLPHLETINLPDPLPDMETMNVICYDFVPQLLSILQDPKIMSGDNLVLDPSNPLAMYKPPDGRLGEALSGSVYQEMYHHHVTDPSKQLLCPLICYTDSTQIDSLSRFSLEPFLFTPALLTHAARNNANVWRPFGYVQQLKSNLRSDKSKLSSSAKARNYHAQLGAMLKSLEHVQTGADSRLQNVSIYLFGKSMQVDLLCPILLIAVDTPAADKLCGHYSSYTEGVQRVTCSCDVSFSALDNPNFTCQPVTWEAMHSIATSGSKEECAAVSQHQCHNAFANIDIGDPVYKIFGSVPTDPMHSVRKGIMARAMSLIFDCMTPLQKSRLDQLAQKFHKSHRQSARKTFPQTDFSNGVTNLSNMTASEECGLVFLLICLAQFDEGWKLLNDALVSKGHNTDLSEVLEALEALSCFDAWSRMDKYWKLSQQNEYSTEAKKSLAKMLTMVRDRLPREKGNGWKLPTFHNIMHIISDMCKYGKPNEANTEVGERNHKVFAKRIGRRCRKQHKTFATQVASRLSDSFVIEKLVSAMHLVERDAEDDSCSQDNAGDKDNEESTKGATHYTLLMNGNNIQVTWQSATEEHLLSCNSDLAIFMHYHYNAAENITAIHCCTELMHNQLLMRCHPSYQGEGPWFDWVSVHFEACMVDGRTYPEGNYPCKVMAILPKQRNEFLEETEIIVQSAQARTGTDSVLFNEWELMDGYFVVSPSSIVESLLVLEIEQNRIAVARSYSEWPSCFMNTSY
jgi:hypothetical protein